MTSPLSIVFKRECWYKNSLLLFIDFVTHIYICIYTHIWVTIEPNAYNGWFPYLFLWVRHWPLRMLKLKITCTTFLREIYYWNLDKNRWQIDPYENSEDMYIYYTCIFNISMIWLLHTLQIFKETNIENVCYKIFLKSLCNILRICWKEKFFSFSQLPVLSISSNRLVLFTIKMFTYDYFISLHALLAFTLNFTTWCHCWHT